ncbi:MAG: HAD family hydrolase [Cyclobacteriaceae bacterium]|nr:HAD family hydrolase [Cyclobacteriaceae bacterium]
MIDKSDILLILDLDETLVYATEEKLEIVEDFKYENYFVYKRPGLDQFLKEINKHFKIGIWSSAGDTYVNEIANNIKPDEINFEIVWARSKCTHRRDLDLDLYYWEKRLDKLKKKGFQLEKILIVDDSPEKSKNNFGNAIYIKEFKGEIADRELAKLFDYLLTLKFVDNVRRIEKRNWKAKYH